MTQQIERKEMEDHKARKNNYYLLGRMARMNPAEVHRAATIVTRFQDREWLEEDVRLVLIQEMENYFDVYGEPDGYQNEFGQYVPASKAKKEIERQIELFGCHCILAQYRNPQTGEWETVDSIGMIVDEHPLAWNVNPYVVDLMNSALEAAENRFIGV